MTPPIYHLAVAADWDAAVAAGTYTQSTVDKTLAEEGFIHCSSAAEITGSANRYYAGRTDLVLLTIDPDRVDVEIRTENLHGGAVLFPHLYGPLNPAAVVAVTPIAPGPDGVFADLTG
jgi:uncharacterized protein (DUF952 family)